MVWHCSGKKYKLSGHCRAFLVAVDGDLEGWGGEENDLRGVGPGFSHIPQRACSDWLGYLLHAQALDFTLRLLQAVLLEGVCDAWTHI